MLIPYRVKNPWKRFPYATVSIIGLNVLVYLLTTEHFLEIRDAVVSKYAFQYGSSPYFTLVTALFLHADVFHILGNMLFFWVFSPPVEDRLGIPRFLVVYFATGIIGALLQAVLDTHMYGATVPCLGASGSIMGVMGAYWYLFSWSTVCVAYFLGFWNGVLEVAAFWVIGSYLVINVVEGYFYGEGNGVANFAHVGGGVSGALLCFALRLKRDSAALSRAKAEHADVKDIKLLSWPELDVIRKDDPQNPEIIRAMLQSILGLGKGYMMTKIFKEAGPQLIEKDPKLVMQYLFTLMGDPIIYSPANLMHLARIAEEARHPRQALGIYEIIRKNFPAAVENETIMYHMALLYKDKLRDNNSARTLLQELLKNYPCGAFESHARVLLNQLAG